MLKEKDTCEIYCFNEETVNRLKPVVNNDNTITMGKMFKVLADDTRIKIAYALTLEHELCVCDVANIVGSTMPTASHHLRLLNKMGLAKSRKEGKLVFYSLEDDHIRQLIMIALSHVEEGISLA